MPYYNVDQEGFWKIGPESLEWQRVLAEAMDVKIARFPLGDPADENTPGVSVLFMPPGYELWRHRHDCYRFEAIIRGSLRAGDRTLGPGDIMTSEPNVFYGPYLVGPEGCITVEVFSTLKGMASVIDEQSDPQAVAWLKALLDDPDPVKREAARTQFEF